MFSINCSVNSSLGYSPFEIAFVSRPKFSLVNYYTEPAVLSRELTTFISNKLRKINIIRTEILDNMQKSKDIMLHNANKGLRPLSLQKHDYVFLQKENAYKLHDHFSGPFVVHVHVYNITSAHTVLLKYPITNKVFDSVVHINRVTKAFVREPTPSYFFSVVSSRQIHVTMKD